MKQPPETVRLKVLAGAALMLSFFVVGVLDVSSPQISRVIVILGSLAGIVVLIGMWFYHAYRN